MPPKPPGLIYDVSGDPGKKPKCLSQLTPDGADPTSCCWWWWWVKLTKWPRRLGYGKSGWFPLDIRGCPTDGLLHAVILELSEYVVGLPQRNWGPDNVPMADPLDVDAANDDSVPGNWLPNFNSGNECGRCWLALCSEFAVASILSTRLPLPRSLAMGASLGELETWERSSDANPRRWLLVIGLIVLIAGDLLKVCMDLCSRGLLNCIQLPVTNRDPSYSNK